MGVGALTIIKGGASLLNAENANPTARSIVFSEDNNKYDGTNTTFYTVSGNAVASTIYNCEAAENGFLTLGDESTISFDRSISNITGLSIEFGATTGSPQVSFAVLGINGEDMKEGLSIDDYDLSLGKYSKLDLSSSDGYNIVNVSCGNGTVVITNITIDYVC